MAAPPELFVNGLGLSLLFMHGNLYISQDVLYVSVTSRENIINGPFHLSQAYLLPMYAHCKHMPSRSGRQDNGRVEYLPLYHM